MRSISLMLVLAVTPLASAQYGGYRPNYGYGQTYRPYYYQPAYQQYYTPPVYSQQIVITTKKSNAFEIYKNDNGWWWELKNDKGDVLARSPRGYDTKDDAARSAVRVAAWADSPIVDRPISTPDPGRFIELPGLNSPNK
jgi:uncharacterized protein YegP (UPF0339 family)